MSAPLLGTRHVQLSAKDVKPDGSFGKFDAEIPDLLAEASRAANCGVNSLSLQRSQHGWASLGCLVMGLKGNQSEAIHFMGYPHLETHYPCEACLLP